MDEATLTFGDHVDRVRAFLRRAARFRGRASVLLALGAAATLAFALTMPRRYESEALLLYRETIRSTDLGANEATSDPARRLALRLKETVFSRTRLEQYLIEFDLYHDMAKKRGYVETVEEMRKHIGFKVRAGDTFAISFHDRDPQKAMAVTARLAQALVDENTRRRQEHANLVRDFLDEESAKNEEKLKVLEAETSRFLALHPEFALSVNNPAAAFAVLLGAVQHRTAGMNPAAAASETRPSQSSRSGSSSASTSIPAKPASKSSPASAAVRALIEVDAEVAVAQKKLSDLLVLCTEEHPDVKAARARLAAAERRRVRVWADTQGMEPEPPVLAESPSRQKPIATSSRSKRKRSSRSRRSSSKQLAAVRVAKQETQEMKVAIQTEWIRLDRALTEARNRQEQLKDKEFTAAITANSVQNEGNVQISILDDAYLPLHPMPPARRSVVLAGFALALALAIGLALASVALDDRIHDASDVAALGRYPLLGVVAAPSRARRSARG